MTKKTRLINKLDSLTAAEKETIINFFTKYPVYENRIDWNSKSLTYSDFEKVFLLADTSRNKIKQISKTEPGILFKDKNCRVISQTKDYIIVMPLDWKCAVYFNSFKCGGSGARWCIGDKNSFYHWNNYISNQNIFYYIFFTKKHPIYGRKMVVLYDIIKKEFSSWDEDDNSFCFPVLIPPIMLLNTEKKKPYSIYVKNNLNCLVFPDNTYYLTTNWEEKIYIYYILKRFIKKTVFKEKAENIDSLLSLHFLINESIDNDINSLYKNEQPAFCYEKPKLMLCDPITICLGIDLIAIFNKESTDAFLERIQEIRRQIAYNMGVVIPLVRIRVSEFGDLAPSDYYISINRAQGRFTIKDINNDSHTQITDQLEAAIKRRISKLLDFYQTEAIIEKIKIDHPVVISEMFAEHNNKKLTTENIWKILQGLLSENVSIRNIVTIFESIAHSNNESMSIRFLIENARRALSRQICYQYADKNKILNVLTLSASLEQEIIESRFKNSSGDYIPLINPTIRRAYLKNLKMQLKILHGQNYSPIILCSGKARYLLKDDLYPDFSELAVLSVDEIAHEYSINYLGVIDT